MKIDGLLLSILLTLVLSAALFAEGGGAHLDDPYAPEYIQIQQISQDTVPPSDRSGDFINNPNNNPFDLQDPGVIEKEVEYDPATGNYIITERIGSEYFRMPTYMTFEEYLEYREEQQRQQYFQQLSGISNGSNSGGLRDPIEEVDVKKDLINRLFGGTEVDIKPQGNIDLTFGFDYQRVDNPLLTQRQRRNGGFDFDMDIQMNVTGKIGEKLNLSTNYNTGATFGTENLMKIDYNSDSFSEDEILKKIEAGNVSLPLKGTLIQGSQNLFGLKTELQFGRLFLTAVASQQRSRQQSIQIQGGAQIQEFEVDVDSYDEDRHFFLTHFNRNNFEEALANLPQINSLFRITEIEVWVTNTRNATENIQDIIAVSDLGEPQVFNNPDLVAPNPVRHRDIFGRQGLPGRVEGDDSTYLQQDYANDLLFEIQNNYPNREIYEADQAVRLLQQDFNLLPGRDFKKVSARKLNPNSEYTVNNDLGIISLNVNLQPNDVLGVAFRYQYNQKNYQVGELSDGVYDPDNASVRYVKMLKTSAQRVELPLWDLMMKNVYSVGAFQVNPEDFLLDIFYEDPGNGFKRFLPESNIAGEPLLRVFNMDRINIQGDPCPDGIFDFIPGVTINPRNGRIMFPVLEPFGDNLVARIDDPDLKEKFNFRQLYDSTRTIAQQYPELNRFSIRGTYKSSISSEISLGAFNLPEGSVRVTGGGRPLVEGVDYEVDYNIGRVRILDESLINSGNPVNVSFEDNTLFGFQSKTMLGLRADYKLNKNIEFGATYLHLFERPFTQKVNIGDDPISNRVYGLDVNYSKEAPWLTKVVDAIPLIDTKEESNITFSAEGAFLKPGHSGAIERLDSRKGKRNRGGTVYIDDFEGTTSGYDLRNAITNWVLASVPQNDGSNSNPLFPESSGEFIDSTITGANRARLSWYRIDDFVRPNDSENYPYVDRIPQNEIFRTRAQQLNVTNSIIPTFDLTFYPDERGPYNFDPPEGTDVSAGLEQNGSLKDPETRWAGIMRSLPNTNFEAANIEFIDFWMLNPFMEGDNPGDLYFNLGNVSEDILRDSRRFFENGLPTDDNNSTTDVTSWGRIPRVQQITNAFANEESARLQQDLGLDGLDNQGERENFTRELEKYETLDPAVYQEILDDPANDDFVFFNSEEFTNAPTTGQEVIERYKRNNDPQGNSALSSGNQINASTNLPDSEDLNRDNSLNEEEEYFQYHIPLRSTPSQLGGLEMAIDPNLVIDTLHQRNAADGTTPRIWYHFKIPIDQFDSRVGGIRDFRAIQFMRMYMKNFRDQVTLRFATLELTRNQWRRYLRPLTGVGRPGVISSTPTTRFEVNAVGLDENSSRVPVNYIRPLGLRPEQLNSANFATNAFQNERSLSLLVEDLGVDTMKGVFKTLDLDMRFFDSLEMFIHAERIEELDFDVDDGDVSVFIRMGSDFENNFYEYEIPLTFTNLEDIAGLQTGSDAYAAEVWREENYMRFLLKDFITLKKNRNGADFPLNQIYEEVVDPTQPDRTYRIKGNPNLGLVKVMMVGVVNRDYEDKANHSVEVWVNELRVSGLDERGGAAAIARLDMQLADFGNLTVAANYSTRGWGGIEQKLAERSREDIFQYDASMNLELGKLLPEDAGVVLPMYMSISETYSTPQFDPYDLDIPLKEKLAATENRADRDSIRKQAQDFSSIKSLNFTNVRKTRSGNNRSAPMPWDISNFKLTYAYTDMNRRNPIIESDRTKTYKGALDYNYSMNPLYISPFKKLIKKDKYLKFLSELNFNLIPNSFSVNNELNRELQVTKYRFTDLEERFNTFYNKRFTWDRNYSLNWDMTRSLKFNFGANNRAIIEELKDFDSEGRPRTPTELREEIWSNLQDFGRTKNYAHNFGVNYTVPFKKIPFLEWISVKANYSATYTWAGSAFGVNGNPGITDTLGNVISNTQRRAINGQLNFESLYRKSKYLEKIDKPRRKSKGRERGDRGGRKSGDKGGGDKGAGGKGGKGSKGGDNKTSSGDKKNNPRSSVQGKDGKGAPPDGKGGKGGKGGKNGKNAAKDRGKDKTKKDKKKVEREPTQIERILIRPLMLVRRLSVDYSEDFGTIIPGYLPTTSILGQSQGFAEPGWDFVGGFQPDIEPGSPDDWLQRSVNRDVPWLSSSIMQNQEVSQRYSRQFKATLKIEPFKDFRIDINADHRFEESLLVNFKDTLADGITSFSHGPSQEVGSFQISYFAARTLFDNDVEGLFERFADSRTIISQRLGDGQHGIDTVGYAAGFGRSQNAVLVPAFLAAYSGQDPNTIPVDPDFTKPLFSILPKLNWKLSYNGLSKIPALKEIFQNVKISHGYRSNLTINSFVNNNNFNENIQTRLDPNENFYSRFNVPNIVISEQFSPLVGISMRMKNGMDLNVDFKKSRNLSMAFNNLIVLTETRTTEYVVGFNYTMKDVYLSFFYGKGANKRQRPGSRGARRGSKGKATDPDKKAKKEKGQDLNFKLDFSYRNDLTVNHNLDVDIQPEATRGTESITLSPSVDYDINKQLNVRLFLDYRQTTPAISASFPTTNTQAGVTIRFSLN